MGDSRFVRVLLKHTACGSDSRTRGTISTNLDGTKANSAMNQNRQQRRRSAAMARRNAYVENYVEHLPEVGPEALGEPGVRHVVELQIDVLVDHGGGEAVGGGRDGDGGLEVQFTTQVASRP